MMQPYSNIKDEIQSLLVQYNVERAWLCEETQLDHEGNRVSIVVYERTGSQHLGFNDPLNAVNLINAFADLNIRLINVRNVVSFPKHYDISLRDRATRIYPAA